MSENTFTPVTTTTTEKVNDVVEVEQCCNSTKAVLLIMDIIKEKSR